MFLMTIRSVTHLPVCGFHLCAGLILFSSSSTTSQNIPFLAALALALTNTLVLAPSIALPPSASFMVSYIVRTLAGGAMPMGVSLGEGRGGGVGDRGMTLGSRGGVDHSVDGIGGVT